MKKLLRAFVVVVFIVALVKLIDHFFFNNTLLFTVAREARIQFLLKKDTLLSRLPFGTGARMDGESVMKELRASVDESANRLVIYLNDGKKIEGIREDEDSQFLTVKQLFGYSGSMTRKIAKKDIARIAIKEKDTSDITDREIMIKRELPDFNFFRSGSYSFFTDQDYFRIEKSISLLQRLHDDFLGTFQALVDSSMHRRIYVIIFGNVDRFHAYRRRVAPGLKNASGFYDLARNQLVFYDFFQHQAYQQVEDHVKKEKEKIVQLKKDNLKYRGKNDTVYSKNLAMIRRYERSLSSYLKRAALLTKSQNVTVLRHEAGHQLSYDLGIVDNNNFDSWLIEGLAEYCATPSVGNKNSTHLKTLKAAVAEGSFIALDELFSYTARNKFYQLDQHRTSIAYAQSWAFFYFLMRPDFRANFFRYLKNVKEHRLFLTVNERVRFLENHFGLSIEEIQAQLSSFIKRS